MNLKLLLGILIPLLVIVSLVVLSSINTGYSIEKETDKSIDFNDIMTNQYQAGYVKIQTIILKNNYFLPKRIDLPKVMACLYDNEGKISAQNMYLTYNEGKASEIPEAPIAQAMIGLSKSYYGGYYTVTRNVEVPAHSTKEVKLMVQPRYSYNYGVYGAGNVNQDYEFDEIIIIEPDENKDDAYYSSTNCANLDDKELEDAFHIKIDKTNTRKPETCTDTDNGYDMKRAGSCTDSYGTYYDRCEEATSRNYEYSCGQVASGTGYRYGCVESWANCPSGCRNGICPDYQ